MELPSLPPTPLDIPDPGNRVTTSTTTSDTPQGTTQTQVAEQRTVQAIPVDLSAVMPGFWQETDFSWSCMRLLCTIALGASIVFGIMALLLPSAQNAGVTLAGLFAGFAFAGKAAQKALEHSTAPG